MVAETGWAHRVWKRIVDVKKKVEGGLVRQPTLDLRWTDQTGSRIFVTQKWEPLVNTSNRGN